MAFGITLAIHPLMQEFTVELFPFRVAIEAGRFGLYSSGGWDRQGCPWLAVEKHLAGKGRELFIGSRMVSVSIAPSAEERRIELEEVLARAGVPGYAVASSQAGEAA